MVRYKDYPDMLLDVMVYMIVKNLEIVKRVSIVIMFKVFMMITI